jgi:hypothetical protein
MSSSENNKLAFFETIADSLTQGTMRKATLSNPLPGVPWRRVTLNIFETSAGTLEVAFHYDNGTKVERKNCSPSEAKDAVRNLVPGQFRTVNLRTATQEIQFEETRQRTFRLKTRAHTEAASIPTHNRAKNYLVPSDSRFLFELGISMKDGTIRRDRHDKFRQINKFVEVISDLVPQERLQATEGISVIDFGSGKHYLTFALHEYLRKLSASSRTAGIEQRADLVTIGQDLADRLEIPNLSFNQSSIATSDVQSADLVVALHACDTATDDAILKAVTANAEFICVAPCCHKYVRQKFTSSADLLPMLRHGIIEERFCEGLTDSLRVIMLESLGYQAKLFEFVSLDHTAKNVMITARKIGKPSHESRTILEKLKEKFKLSDFYLDMVLANQTR